jgi:hypothetical protein
MYLYALFYVRRVRDSLYPWDLGYGVNQEWINMLSVFDNIELEMDAWNKIKKKEEEVEDSNAIPPSKGSIKDKILGHSGDEKQKPKKPPKDPTSFEIDVPWKNAKQTIKTIRKFMNI